jgi:hypothetical protein
MKQKLRSHVGDANVLGEVNMIGPGLDLDGSFPFLFYPFQNREQTCESCDLMHSPLQNIADEREQCNTILLPALGRHILDTVCSLS